ncbi:M1 family metallopeptidase [Microbispora sp. ATCC PTA-5024]|uniref:M1 family metallopeptidase n=1 Tax=Microbispora sp. ATCC PTA-5024 TaxID=316330 RepID=UPI00055BC86A|nr:M1 family metallopeptidase [Microbispora sp. ATCC PTA-5024]
MRRTPRAQTTTAVLAATALAAAAVTVLSTGGGATASSGPEPGAETAGDRLFPYLGNGGYDVASYDVAFDYRPGETAMRSAVRITASARQALSRFSLDSAGQAIRDVTVDGRRARFAAHGEKLVVTPERPVRKGERFRVEIGYTADRTANPPSPASPDSPAHFDNWYNKDDGFVLFGQPDRAHLFFPMNDHPADKATVTFRVTVPKDLQVAANGTLRSRSTSRGRTTYVYGTRDPIPTQTVQVAVGHFRRVRQTGPHGLPLTSFITPGSYEKAKPSVRLIPSQVAWVEKQIGARYPFEAYGVLGVQGGYAAAFESAGLSTFSAEAGLTKPEETPTMVHELVHQYFGNAVSEKSWDDMWISEGHATYYTLLYKDEKGFEKLADSVRRAYTYDQDTRGTTGPPGRLKDPLDLLGSTNAPGFLMLYGLRLKVGDATFRAIERTFFEKYRHKAASTQDFVDVANTVSHRDLTAYITSWIYGAETPPMPAAS